MSNRIVDGIELKKENITPSHNYKTSQWYNNTVVAKPLHDSAYTEVKAYKPFVNVYEYPFNVTIGYEFTNYPAKLEMMGIQHIGFDKRLDIEPYGKLDNSESGMDARITNIIPEETYDYSVFNQSYTHSVFEKSDVGIICEDEEYNKARIRFLVNNGRLYYYSASESYKYINDEMYHTKNDGDDEKVDVCEISLKAKSIVKVRASQIKSEYEQGEIYTESTVGSTKYTSTKTYNPHPAIKWEIYLCDINSSSEFELVSTVIDDRFVKIEKSDGEVVYLGADLTKEINVDYRDGKEISRYEAETTYEYDFEEKHIEYDYFYGSINDVNATYGTKSGHAYGEANFDYKKIQTIKDNYHENPIMTESWLTSRFNEYTPVGKINSDGTYNSLYVTSDSQITEPYLLLVSCGFSTQQRNEGHLYYDDLVKIGAM